MWCIRRAIKIILNLMIINNTGIFSLYVFRAIMTTLQKQIEECRDTLAKERKER